MTEDALRELARARRRELVSSWRKKKKDAEDAEDAEGSRERTVVLPDTESMDAHRPPGA